MSSRRTRSWRSSGRVNGRSIEPLGRRQGGAAPLATASGASPPPSTDDQVAFQQSLAQKGFIGDIVIPDFNNSARWEGYASSSYMGRVPFLVLFPADSAAVQLAVTATKQFNAERTQDLKVVARSGGHQYSGTSLGNSTTIVVNMEKIAFEWHQEIPIRRKWRSNDATIIDVKPALRLRELSAELKDRKMMSPHGECPEVAIGGHAQTGGYGHLLRSYGLTVDQVRSFSIVLADGKEYSIVHPSFPAAQKVHKDNDQLFRGVLSGSAGSFGIVTEYSFEGISDMSNPRVASYTAVVPYSRENLEAIMHEVQEITKKEANGEVPSSCDLFISVESRGNLNVVSPVILVEAADCNAASHDPIPNATHPFWALRTTISKTPSLVFARKDNLSELMDRGVRRFPITTRDGREFPYPYKKRVNTVDQAISMDFVRAFVAKIDEAIKDPGLRFVSQMLLGGGKHKAANDGHMPHADYVWGFVYDVFYLPGHETHAEQLQADMGKIVSQYFINKTSKERRFFWGSFSQTGSDREIDLSDAAVREMYFDDAEWYAQLQALKKRIDPQDLFHTLMTVRP